MPPFLSFCNDSAIIRDAKPKKWGENVPGVRTHLTTEEQVIALTFDACGGKEGSGYDEKLTGRRPLFFRSGTAYYIDIAAGVVQDLGFEVAGYNALGDAGATYNTEQVYKALLKARSGSIVLAHMNHPEKDTAEGIMKAIPELQKAGYRFVLLTSYTLN
ncbi:hypothetical protein [Paenibacillus sp. V4I5]|uniref:hypothetical protein n=1 Tax=Paenibacillus sp. V4I5 TaxID=3042306 RepID=UPI0027947660|nr:hypothetical protein [Paenibacillus sp. V4I5]MDQ0917874.1 hypothetical protein [Paenibacillus sp. V4I5]